VLPDGTVAYLAPSHEFPLVTVSITFKGGSSLDPADVPGLASMTARMIREGGTTKRKPAEFDETLDFLATEVGVSANDTFTTATMNCLKTNFDESLALFVEMLRTPGFDAGRLETSKARVIESLKQRNDDASSIIGREWKRLVYGPDHFEAAEPTDATVAAIDRSGLAEMHGRIVHPGNAIVAVSGDFEEPEMLATLASTLRRTKPGGPDGNMAIVHLTAIGTLDDKGRPCIIPPGASADPAGMEEDSYLRVDRLLAGLRDALPDRVGILVVLDACRPSTDWPLGIDDGAFTPAVEALMAVSNWKRVWVMIPASTGQNSYSSAAQGASGAVLDSWRSGGGPGSPRWAWRRCSRRQRLPGQPRGGPRRRVEASPGAGAAFASAAHEPSTHRRPRR
jgi:hypothetical protein